MRRHVLTLVTVLVAGASLPLASQANRTQQMRAAMETIKGADIFRDVSYIASDANMGRATPSPGFDSAATYIAKMLKQLGVKPLGDKGSYFQYYSVTRSVLDTLKTKGAIGRQPLKWGDDFIINSFLVPGVRTANVIYVGHGVRAPKLGLDPYAGLDIKGKWVLVNAGIGGVPNWPAGQTRATMGTLGVDYTTVTEEVKERGALGILLVPNASLLNGWRRAATTGRDLNPSVGRAYSREQAPRIVLSAETVRRLFEGTSGSAVVVLAADSTKLFPGSVDLGASKRLTIDFQATTTDDRPMNVIGLIEGADPVLKNEWITLSAHLDGAIGRGRNAAGDSVFNAADDDGSGSAANMAVVRALMSGPRPKRSIMVVWDSGEEVGLWGTRSIAYGPLAKNLVAHFSIDMIGRSKEKGTNKLGEQELTDSGEVYVTGAALISTVLDTTVNKVARDYQLGRINTLYDRPNDQFFYPRVDAGPYMENGIPVIGFFTGIHGDYHALDDDPELLDPAKMEMVAKLVYGTLWHVSDGLVKPLWDKPLTPSLWFVKPRN